MDKLQKAAINYQDILYKQYYFDKEIDSVLQAKNSLKSKIKNTQERN